MNFIKGEKDFPQIKHFSRGAIEIYRAVEDCKLDFAFVGWPNQPKGKLKYEQVAPIKTAIVGKKNKFKAIKTANTLNELVDLPWVYAPREPIHKVFDTVKNHPSGHVVNDIHSLRNIILSGDAIGEIEYDYFTEKELKTLDFSKLPTRFPNAFVYLIYRSDISSEMYTFAQKIKSFTVS